MSAIETLKNLRADFLNDKNPHEGVLSGKEKLAIIEGLPELLAAKDERDALLEQKRQPSMRMFYAVYIQFGVEHEPSFKHNILECVCAINQAEAYQRVWDKIESIYRDPILRSHMVSSATDNLPN